MNDDFGLVSTIGRLIHERLSLIYNSRGVRTPHSASFVTVVRKTRSRGPARKYSLPDPASSLNF